MGPPLPLVPRETGGEPWSALPATPDTEALLSDAAEGSDSQGSGSEDSTSRWLLFCF